MKIHYKISTNSPYPIETTGMVEASGWQIVARKAVDTHKKILREKKKLRHWGETTIIKMTRLPDSLGGDE